MTDLADKADKARALYADGNGSELIAFVTAALATDVAPQDAPHAHVMLRLVASTLAEAGAHADALRVCATADDIAPHADTFAITAAIYEHAGRHALALDCWSSAHARRPEADVVPHASGWLAMAGKGRCLAALGELETAAMHFEDALADKALDGAARDAVVAAVAAVRAEWLRQRTGMTEPRTIDESPAAL